MGDAPVQQVLYDMPQEQLSYFDSRARTSFSYSSLTSAAVSNERGVAEACPHSKSRQWDREAPEKGMRSYTVRRTSSVSEAHQEHIKVRAYEPSAGSPQKVEVDRSVSDARKEEHTRTTNVPQQRTTQTRLLYDPSAQLESSSTALPRSPQAEAPRRAQRDIGRAYREQSVDGTPVRSEPPPGRVPYSTRQRENPGLSVEEKEEEQHGATRPSNFSAALRGFDQRPPSSRPVPDQKASARDTSAHLPEAAQPQTGTTRPLQYYPVASTTQEQTSSSAPRSRQRDTSSSVEQPPRHQGMQQEWGTGGAQPPAGMGREEYDRLRDEEENCTFHPQINTPSRSYRSRTRASTSRGREGTHHPHEEEGEGGAAGHGHSSSRHAPEKQNETDRDGKPTLSPDRSPSEAQPAEVEDEADPAQVFSRLYADAQRYNKEKAEQEKRIERQRQQERGESPYDWDKGCEPRKTSSAEETEEAATGRETSPTTKRGASAACPSRVANPELFARLSRPTTVTLKYEKQKELAKLEEQEKEQREAERKRRDMEKIAHYSWGIVQRTFTFSDLATQNALYAS